MARSEDPRKTLQFAPGPRLSTVLSTKWEAWALAFLQSGLGTVSSLGGGFSHPSAGDREGPGGFTEREAMMAWQGVRGPPGSGP